MQELIGGVLTIVVGGAFLLQSLRYPLGRLNQMGPGYFPVVLSLIMIGLGLVLLAQTRRPAFGLPRGFAVRPVILIPAGMSLFALLIERAGIIPASVSLVVLSAMSEPVVRPLRVLGLTLTAVALIYVVFIVILRMPFVIARW